MKLKAFLLIATLHFAVLASCAKETPETPARPCQKRRVTRPST